MNAVPLPYAEFEEAAAVARRAFEAAGGDAANRDALREALIAALALATPAIEKRGAVNVLTYAAEITRRSAAEMAAATGGPVVEGVVLGIAASLDQYADQIESGEVTL